MSLYDKEAYMFHLENENAGLKEKIKELEYQLDKSQRLSGHLLDLHKSVMKRVQSLRAALDVIARPSHTNNLSDSFKAQVALAEDDKAKVNP